MAGVKFIGNQRSAPAWMADWAGREHLALFPAKLDPAQFSDQSGIQVTVGAAGAAIGATAVPVTALTYNALPSTVLIAAGNVVIPAGTTLKFANNKFALLTADAKQGDTSLTVAALLTALVSGDTAYYSKYGTLFVPSGTLVGRTYAERDANTAFGPADVVTPDDEIYLTAFDVPDLNNNADVELYRQQERIYENYLPNYATLTAGQINKIRALYQSSKAVN